MKKFTILLLLLSIGLCELMAANTATLKDFSGDLKIIRLFKRLEPTVGMTLEAKDMIRTQSGKAVVTLPDQSLACRNISSAVWMLLEFIS